MWYSRFELTPVECNDDVAIAFEVDVSAVRHLSSTDLRLYPFHLRNHAVKSTETTAPKAL